MAKNLVRCALAALAVTTAIAPAAAQERLQLDPGQTYVHERSGMAFPARIGDFVRTGVTAFNLDATDIGVGYDLARPGADAAVTVYVYPAPAVAASERDGACTWLFEDAKRSIVGAHAGVELLADGAAPPAGGQQLAGKQAVYGFEGIFRGRPRQLRSELDLYCYVASDWLIKYRITHPAEDEVGDAIAELMAGLTWPGGAKTLAALP